ncbi:rho guanine nucleotide exchange factor 12 isoform X2 [Vespula squamosa]|uniref:Rho guanine nucleotide exchange factor 12 isoform X2 n=1 Tax=Vespula squamosa TaxID=30214 RepID=A0ABD2A152_VESSQ
MTVVDASYKRDKREHRGGGTTGNADSTDDPSSREEMSEMMQQNISSKPKTSNINRSESYKERIHHKVRHKYYYLEF